MSKELFARAMRVALNLSLGLALPVVAQQAADPNLGRLEREITRLERISGGRMGVAAIHLETGRAVYLNRSERALLLQKIWRREALSAESSTLLLDIMTCSTTGALRIKGMLPPDVRVTHKTGTIGETTNDVGITALPDNAGNVVTVVFVKESKLAVETRERAIAQVSRVIYDYFLFNPR